MFPYLKLTNNTKWRSAKRSGAEGPLQCLVDADYHCLSIVPVHEEGVLEVLVGYAQFFSASRYRSGT